MKQIRWHGRGGNGAFTAARLLGVAASVYEGKSAQAFPSFGPERRGAPVLGFTRIAEKTITDHSQVYECDCVIVLDETLCEVANVAAGLKPDGVLVINTRKSADAIAHNIGFDDPSRIVVIDATDIALELLGNPIVNTIMLGAAVGATGMVSMESVEAAIDEVMGRNLREKNKKAAREAYKRVKEAVMQ
ncbi:MAG: pyruvate ferredoxin oxidoreductase [Gracilibacteraceae bacterium]|nr:pyruvate ferredoxin oxidoreductase [Gracilibacteraceae bacterium]